MHHPTLLALGAVFLGIPAVNAGLYPKSSPVLQVDARNYDRLIAKSNYTSIVEFYAPWCGHCQNLKPAYEKAAKSLDGLAKVAAVNCDDDDNKPLCGSMGIKGFPTLKIVRPSKKTGKPVVEDYQGERSVKGITTAVQNAINNHVTRVSDKDLDNFLQGDGPKALLFSDKGTTSATLRALAIDFLDVISVGQVRNKEAKTCNKYNVDKFPTLILLPGGDADPIVYEGEMKKAAMVEFLSQAGSPNPDPAPKESKAKNDTKAKKDSKPKPKTTSTTSQSTETADASESPVDQQAPVIIESAPPLPTIHSPEKLAKECLNEKSHTCVLVFVSSPESEAAKEALVQLAELSFKHHQSKRHLFPMFVVPQENTAAEGVKQSLKLSSDVEVVALNARRGWWRHYAGADFSHENLEVWIDQIRMSEGEKLKLPEGIILEVVPEEAPRAPEEAPEAEPSSSAEESSTVESVLHETAEVVIEVDNESTKEKPAKPSDHVHEEL